MFSSKLNVLVARWFVTHAWGTVGKNTHFRQIGKNEKKLKVHLSWQFLAHFSETFSTCTIIPEGLKVKQNILCPHWDRTQDL